MAIEVGDRGPGAPTATGKASAHRQSAMSLTITCGTCHANVEAPDPTTRAEEIALQQGVGPYTLPCHCAMGSGKAKAAA